MVALVMFACSSKSSLKGGPGTGGAASATQTAGGSQGAGGSLGSGGIPGTGGVGSGGKSGMGGVGSGGSPGTGGGTSDGGVEVARIDDGGVVLVGVQDAGQDAPLVLDAAVDLAIQTCGDAAACGSGQACVLVGGGAVPWCQPPEDGGVCGLGLVPVDSCGGVSGPPPYRPGCTNPPPTPKCLGLTDGCSDPCSCVCPGAGCYKGPGYTICSMP